VIGGGIAAAWLVQELEAVGREVTVLERDAVATGASGNPGGLVMPRIDADESPAALFYRDAFLHAADRYARSGAFEPCGGLLRSDEERFATISAFGQWPEASFSWCDGSVHIPSAGVLRPKDFVERALAETPIIRAEAAGLRREEDGWHLLDTGGDTHGPFAAVVVASGGWGFSGLPLPLAPKPGQVDVFDATPPGTAITDGAYVAPLGARMIAGASYRRDGDLDPEVLAEDSASNREAAARLSGSDPGMPAESRASIRATTPDRHPLAGPLYDDARAIAAYQGLAQGLKTDYPEAPYRPGLYVLAGLGSRGLVTAPILAGHVASQIGGGISPLSRQGAGLVHPGRFLIRAIRRREIEAGRRPRNLRS
jgi:tRNA 5-methylaminomethyl-2-thiouridine biosynthesis bifunctional protein